ncbi:blue copper protein [Planococcus antarcticus DSM 14505]|uniref:Blue copper protein n=1 Tax=Planococcus antarcticus DSM 14505 TaxID=1185653 RepID=A0AA87LV22_9BACL|nr:plastocyanin/azurin family copper-binding protein [Planococcus antarcticus]EIM06810.1 blue copper protein [Planococcus antarcticus DSM 14505]
MINKKFGFILATAVLSLAACGEEQSTAEDNTEVAVEQESASEKDSTSDEETTAETAEEEPMEESAPEAMSGTASDLLSNGEMTSFVFNEAGEFSIFCEPHPVMQMTVVVEEGAELMGEVEVDIADYEFGEETITVAPGTTIVWTNQDQVQHNVAIK